MILHYARRGGISAGNFVHYQQKKELRGVAVNLIMLYDRWNREAESITGLWQQ